ncbi:hypothetical protein JCM14076_21130 [Methylosoma difficile]
MLKNNFQLGFSLTELLIVIGVIGILASIAIPSFDEMLERRKLIDAAEAILADLRWAKAEAIKRNIDVTVTFTDGNNGSWAYWVNPGNKALEASTRADFKEIGLSQNFGSNDTSFDYIRGGSENGTITLSSPNYQLKVILSVMGRSRVCAVDNHIGDYEICV